MKIFLNAKLERTSGFRLDIELETPAKGITGFYGHSGSGKTTLLRLISGLERGQKTDSIEIRTDNTIWQDSQQFVSAHARRIGYVTQNAQLFPHLNVAQNLAFASKRAANKQRLAPEDIIDWLEIRHLLTSDVATLSGGETQRVAIARALHVQPDILLMDEPLGSVDKAARHRIMPYIRRIADTTGIPVIYVSHSLEEMNYLADHLFLLRNGSIVAQGPTDQLTTSLLLVKDEGDEVNSVLKCRFESHNETYGLSCLTIGETAIYLPTLKTEPGHEYRIQIGARDVSIALSPAADSSILNILPARVVDIESPNKGPNLLLRLDIEGQYLLSRITRKSFDHLDLTVGTNVYAQIKTVALLNPDGH